MLKRALIFVSLILIAAVIYIYFTLYPQFPVANGYAAKKMCSCTFIAERSQESIQNQDLGISPLSLTKTIIDHDNKSVTSTLFGFTPRTAVYRKDVGCILLIGEDDHNIHLNIDRPILQDTIAWPQGNYIAKEREVSGVNYALLEEAMNNAFDENRDMDSLMTRAVVVVYKDQIVGESYANGFTADTEILGWSMAKSVTATMIGILIKEGKLSLEDKQIFPEWTDDRKDISLKDLMQMQSGLDFSEDYASLSDATNMLFKSENVTTVPKSDPLAHQPGTHWSYSSGTTNLLAGLVQDKLNNQEIYLKFPYDRIFNKLGMNSAVLETDESGHYIGSSFLYATPRDWAKFGLLYLHQGNWYGDQIVDTSFVDFVQMPASESKGVYGGQFWLNYNYSTYPDAPADLYSCSGFQGQFVYIIPSYDLVIVRMGLANDPIFDRNKFLKEIISAIDKDS